MLSSYRVDNFRSFDHFEVADLARVNLFVGGNNSGKTSLLEAAELLLSPMTAELISEIPQRREEDFASAGIDISHLFHGHRAEIGSKIAIGEINNLKQRVLCEVVPGDAADFNPRRQIRRPAEPGSKELKPTLGFRVSFGDGSKTIWLPVIVRDDMLTTDKVFLEERDVPPVQYIGADARTSTDLWQRIVLTPEEDMATEALRVIEPGIERIAAVTNGFVVRMAHSEQRIPLGSMGDGIRRLLNLSMSLATAATGTLIVDEIDTGLHHSVMTRMWRLVVEASRRLNVQVLATTHSGDCVRSLAALCEQIPDLASEVSLHRVVRGAASTVRYSAEEIQTAAAAHIEVR